MAQPYITTITYWISETEFVAVPVLSVSGSNDEAIQNAQRVVALLAAASPDILAGGTRVTFSPAAIPDAAMREFLERLGRERPDLAQHAAVLKVPRGRQGGKEST